LGGVEIQRKGVGERFTTTYPQKKGFERLGTLVAVNTGVERVARKKRYLNGRETSRGFEQIRGRKRKKGCAKGKSDLRGDQRGKEGRVQIP